MSPGLIIALVCLALFIGYLIGRNRDQSIPTSSSKTPIPRPFQENLDYVDINTIENLLRDKRKIEAIKFYRETTGASLKDAKKSIEDIEKSL